MDKKPFVPFVPASRSMDELTFKALFLGALMAVTLGAANAYVGMRAGLTVAATCPAARPSAPPRINTRSRSTARSSLGPGNPGGNWPKAKGAEPRENRFATARIPPSLRPNQPETTMTKRMTGTSLIVSTLR